MKTIKGKIEFGIIPCHNNPKGHKYIFRQNGLDYFVDEEMDLLRSPIPLSKITEEQATKFVESKEYGFSEKLTIFDNYLDENIWSYSAKESLISLLKANYIWIKEWIDAPIKPELGFDCEGETAWESYDNRLEDYYNEIEDYNKLPDDLLLIKLT